MSIENTVPEDRYAQRDMHKNYFDRCRFAIDQGFYMEAILMEYAAIEARLEVILGMLGLPCNKFLDDSKRREVFISQRINCLKKQWNLSDLFSESKLTKSYFKKLEDWIAVRNGYIHGLYKSEIRYKSRIKNAQETAEKGLELSRLLYNEASRIRRIYRKEGLISVQNLQCMSDNCKLNKQI